jgi:type IV pilus assembly protein PilV
MRKQTHGSNSGFTLVEVLIALVILSIGMLGIAALLLNSLQSSRTALLRSQAVVLASDLAERIRSNRSAGTVYDTSVTPAPALVPACESTGSDCSAADMASNDLKRWQNAVSAALPGGAGNVVVQQITTTVNRYTIAISWVQSGDSDNASLSITADI